VALAQRLASALSGVEAGDADEVDRYAGPFLEALADDFNTPAAIAELERLSGSEEPGARRAARSVGERILGLTFAA
jgi:hypothetical protein